MLYEKDKFKTMTLRLTEKQYDYLKHTSDILGVSPSAFLRMVINSTLSAAESTEKIAVDTLEGAKPKQ